MSASMFIVALFSFGLGMVVGQVRSLRRVRDLQEQERALEQRSIEVSDKASQVDALSNSVLMFRSDEAVAIFDHAYDAGRRHGIDAAIDEMVAQTRRRRYRRRPTSTKRPGGVGAPRAMAQEEVPSHAPRS